MQFNHGAVFLVLGAACAAGCGGGDIGGAPPQALGEVAPMSVRAVDWNPKSVPLGSVAAVGELEGTVAVLADVGVTLFSGGVYTGSDGSVTEWRTAATIPAADGNGTWIAGVDGAGRVLRLRAGSYFEPVSDLYGLTSDDITGLAALDGAKVGFAVGGALAVADGMNVAHYDGGVYKSVAGGGGRAAAADGAKVYVFNTGDGKSTTYELAGAEEVAFDGAGKLVARTKGAVYLEDAAGGLALRYESKAAALHGLATSAGRVYIADGAEILMLEAGVLSGTKGAALPETATLIGSPSGDVWTLSGGELSKLAPQVGDEDDRLLWETKVQPVYLDSCTPCHAPGGSAGIELSTYNAWVARRAKIKERVVEQKTMPPSGVMFSEEERAAISAWATSTQ